MWRWNSLRGPGHPFNLPSIPGHGPRERNNADLLAPVSLPAAVACSGESGVRLVHRLPARGREVVPGEVGTVGALVERGRRRADRHYLPERTGPPDPSTGPSQSFGSGVDEHSSRRSLSALAVLVPHRSGRPPKLPPRVPRSSARDQSSTTFCFGVGPDDRPGAAMGFQPVATANGSRPRTGPRAQRGPFSGPTVELVGSVTCAVRYAAQEGRPRCAGPNRTWTGSAPPSASSVPASQRSRASPTYGSLRVIGFLGRTHPVDRPRARSSRGESTTEPGPGRCVDIQLPEQGVHFPAVLQLLFDQVPDHRR